MDSCVTSALSRTTKSDIPIVGTRSTVDEEVANFMRQNPSLHMGGKDDFTTKREEHLKVAPSLLELSIGLH
ncbi:hypothetical protein FOC4_g10005152 [Fusarium odoratissimum]|uniref:Uncharacterized protein n=1 Tax=Fusarium oxysporum f. sp. cubense (strain race 4) TaxID=2502994 RepID=N1RR03_FUSC4|nr:hypothetical protein FOC4_g10005152 [Fusarium odoratissimum]